MKVNQRFQQTVGKPHIVKLLLQPPKNNIVVVPIFTKDNVFQLQTEEITKENAEEILKIIEKWIK